MSREFGEYVGGYFHDKIRSAKEDLELAHFELHRKLVPILESIYDIAYAVSSVEAGDSGEYASKEALRKNIPILLLQLESLNKKVNISPKDELYHLTNTEGWKL